MGERKRGHVGLKNVAIFFVILISADHVSSQLLNHGYFEKDFAAFELINGTQLTPTSISHLKELLPSIESVLSVGFLLWIETEISERYEILELIKEFDVTGTSSDLVDKLLRHHQSITQVNRMDRFLQKLESGEFVEDLADDMEDHSMSLSKSVVRATLRKYGEGLVRNKLNESTCEFADLFEGIVDGNTLSLTTFGQLLLNEDCTQDMELFHIDGRGSRLIDWSDFGNVLQNLAHIMATIWSVAGYINDLPKFAFLKPQFALQLSLLGIAITFLLVLVDIGALITGNLNGLQIAYHSVSLAIGVINLIAGLVALTGVGAGVAAIIAVASMVVMFIFEWIVKLDMDARAENHVLKLNRVMPLTDAEKKREKQRYKDGLPPDPELEALLSQTLYNMALVSARLDTMRDDKSLEGFERFVFPAVDSNADEYENSIANLATKKLIRLTRWAPNSALVDTLPDGRSHIQSHIICGPECESGTTCGGSFMGYSCWNSIGVTEYRLNKDHNSTLFALGEGRDTAVGSTDFTNVFMVEKGWKNYTGGDTNDVYLVLTGDLEGAFDGGLGYNTLDLSAQNISSNIQVKVDLSRGSLHLGSKLVSLNNLHIINGRENVSDTIIGNCATYIINGRGGSKGVVDVIEIPKSEQCDYSLFIEINNDTIIRNSGYSGSFNYNINQTFESNARLEITPGVNSSHNILIQHEFDLIYDVSCESREITIMSTNLKDVFTSNVILRNETDTYFEPTIIFPDQISIKAENREENCIVTTIFNLTEPQEMVRAPEFGQALFLVKTQVGLIIGKDGNDTVFLLDTAFVSERISGGQGVNTLILGQEFWNTSNVEIDMSQYNHKVWFNDTIGRRREMLVQGFSQVLGREGFREDVTIGCEAALVDLKGGTDGNSDQITIITGDCNDRSTLVRTSQHTVLENRALDGNFVYFIPLSDDIQLKMNFDPGQRLNHTIQFDFDLEDILRCTVTNQSRSEQYKLSLMSRERRTLDLPLSDIRPEKDTDDFESPILVTADGVILRANRQNHIKAIHNITNHPTPKDGIYGANFADNIFLMSSTVQGLIQGGVKDDIFILYNGVANFTGNLRGGFGSDRLVLDEKYISHQVMDMSDFDSFEEVVGRKGVVDTIQINCATTLVNGMGGLSEDEPDVIQIPTTENCPYDVLLVIGNFTVVKHNGGDTSGEFKYYIQTQGGHVAIDFGRGGNHTVIIPHKKYEIKDVQFSDTTGTGAGGNMSVSTFNATYSFNILFDGSTFEQKQPTIVLQDDSIIQLKIKNISTSTNTTATFVLTGQNENEDANATTTAGFVFLENIFLLNGGTHGILGGDLNDTFIIANETTTGLLLDGAGGSNTIAISDEISNDFEIQIIPFSLALEIIQTLDSTSPTIAIFRNIETIIGRNGSTDRISIDCNVKVVDGGGGASADFPDVIIVPDYPACINYSTSFVIRRNTDFQISAKHGDFIYALNDESGFGTGGEFFIECINNCTNPNMTHTITVPFDVDLIHNITIEDCRVDLLSESQDVFFSYGYLGQNPDDVNGSCQYPKLIFPDAFLLDVSHVGSIHGRLLSNGSTIVSLIETYTSRALKFNSSIMIITENDEYVLVGREGFDMLQSSPDHPSHIHGNGGMNTYVIGKNNESKSIPDVFVYLNNPEERNVSIEIFDLTQIIHPIRRRENDYYLPKLTLEEGGDGAGTLDLVLTVLDRNIQTARITFFDWDWLLDGGIFLFGEMYMKLEYAEEADNDEGDVLKFTPIPANFTNQTTIILDLVELEEGTELYFLERDLPEQNAVLRQGDDIVFTNVFDLDNKENFFILFKEFMGGEIGKVGVRNIPTNVALRFSNVDINMDTVRSDYVIDDIEIIKDKVTKEVEKDVFAFQCLSEGLHPNPKDCTTYYRCVKMGDRFTPISLPCPSGSIFCQSKLACDVESEECPCIQHSWKRHIERSEL